MADEFENMPDLVSDDEDCSVGQSRFVLPERNCRNVTGDSQSADRSFGESTFLMGHAAANLVEASDDGNPSIFDESKWSDDEKEIAQKVRMILRENCSDSIEKLWRMFNRHMSSISTLGGSRDFRRFILFEEFEQVLVVAFVDCIRRSDTAQIGEMLDSLGSGGDDHKKLLFMLNQIY
jgi:hypothetical protein